LPFSVVSCPPENTHCSIGDFVVPFLTHFVFGDLSLGFLPPENTHWLFGDLEGGEKVFFGSFF